MLTHLLTHLLNYLLTYFLNLTDLLTQVHYALATMLRDNASGRGSRLVPLTLTMSRITEMMNDEAKRSTPSLNLT